jgi:hypothetical protein
MTEQEWLACVHGEEMLDYLRTGAKVVRSPKGRRKLRLFACGCCRQVWQLIEDSRSQRLVELAEQLADGLGNALELAKAEREAGLAKSDADEASAGLSPMSHVRRTASAISAALRTAGKDAYKAARLSSFGVLCSVGGYWSIEKPNPAWEDQEERHTALLRCIFGNPFRPSPPLPPPVLSWNDGTVRRIAQGSYEERRMPEGTLDSGRLAILADALLDAGCEDEELIQHCRSEAPHYRGCWPLDLILNKR